MEHKISDVVRLVNLFNCLAYDWVVKDQWKVTRRALERSVA